MFSYFCRKHPNIHVHRCMSSPFSECPATVSVHESLPKRVPPVIVWLMDARNLSKSGLHLDRGARDLITRKAREDAQSRFQWRTQGWMQEHENIPNPVPRSESREYFNENIVRTFRRVLRSSSRPIVSKRTKRNIMLKINKAFERCGSTYSNSWARYRERNTYNTCA